MDKRFFIVSYSVFKEGELINGTLGTNTINADYVNRKEMIESVQAMTAVIDKEFINIISIMEINAKDYKRFWEE